MRLAVAGYRDYHDREKVFQLLDLFRETNLVEEIITGDARGVDSLARDYARINNIKLTVFTAQWNKYGKRAGPLRNQEIIDNSDFLIAFVHMNSIGTLDTIAKAKNKGINIIKYDI